MNAETIAETIRPRVPFEGITDYTQTILSGNLPDGMNAEAFADLVEEVVAILLPDANIQIKIQRAEGCGGGADAYAGEDRREEDAGRIADAIYQAAIQLPEMFEEEISE